MSVGTPLPLLGLDLANEEPADKKSRQEESEVSMYVYPFSLPGRCVPLPKVTAPAGRASPVTTAALRVWSGNGSPLLLVLGTARPVL